MKTHLNTLFITLEGAYLRKDGEAVDIRHENQSKLRIPLHNLDGIVTMTWNSTISTPLMAACAKAGVTLSFLNPHGKFLAASHGFSSGNILLRREQYRQADSEPASLALARNMVAAKLANCRHVLLRTARDHGPRDASRSAILLDAAAKFGHRIRDIPRALTLDQLRGIEGDAATYYFAAFPSLLVNHDPAIQIAGRSRRPPRDPVNALLSFLYSLLMHECRSALEAAGLDPQCGFLHRDRPGRPSLALDLMEEFRPLFADRLTLNLINRRQLNFSDFERRENNAILLREDSRKKVLTAWQERKQEVVTHPFLQEKTSYGLLPHLQARLLARYLRQDLDAYPALILK